MPRGSGRFIWLLGDRNALMGTEAMARGANRTGQMIPQTVADGNDAGPGAPRRGGYLAKNSQSVDCSSISALKNVTGVVRTSAKVSRSASAKGEFSA